MTTILDMIHRFILWLCAALMVAITFALTTQIISRYVFNAPVKMTDDIAEIALIWLTFLGASIVYRERGHIGVDLVSSLHSDNLRRAIDVSLHLLVVVLMGYILTQVGQIQPLMSRLEFGTIPHSWITSKFTLVQIPFATGAVLTLIFALEAMVQTVLPEGEVADGENEQ